MPVANPTPGGQAKYAAQQAQGAAQSPAAQLLAMFGNNPQALIQAFNKQTPGQQYGDLNSGFGGSQLMNALLKGGMSQQGLSQFLQNASMGNADTNKNYSGPSAASYGGTPGYTPGGSFGPTGAPATGIPAAGATQGATPGGGLAPAMLSRLLNINANPTPAGSRQSLAGGSPQGGGAGMNIQQMLKNNPQILQKILQMFGGGGGGGMRTQPMTN